MKAEKVCEFKIELASWFDIIKKKVISQSLIQEVIEEFFNDAYVKRKNGEIEYIDYLIILDSIERLRKLFNSQYMTVSA